MPGMDFCELFKLPDLLGHFHEHKQLDEELSFIEFMGFHYGNDNPEPADEHRLPFKDHHCCAGHTHTAVTCHNALRLAPEFLKEHPKDLYSFNFISQFSATIWQPPKFS